MFFRICVTVGSVRLPHQISKFLPPCEYFSKSFPGGVHLLSEPSAEPFASELSPLRTSANR